MIKLAGAALPFTAVQHLLAYRPWMQMAVSKDLVVEALVLLRGLSMALAEDDPDGFSRYTWFVDLVTAVLDDAAASRPMNKRYSSPNLSVSVGFYSLRAVT